MPLQHVIIPGITSVKPEARIFPLGRKKMVVRNAPREIIAFATKKRIEMVRVADINYVQAEDNYSRIHILGQLPVFLSKTLKEIDQILGSEGFMRVHQSYLVHPAQILNYDFNARELTLRNGFKIPVSRANIKRVSMELLNFWKA